MWTTAFFLDLSKLKILLALRLNVLFKRNNCTFNSDTNGKILL